MCSVRRLALLRAAKSLFFPRICNMYYWLYARVCACINIFCLVAYVTTELVYLEERHICCWFIYVLVYVVRLSLGKLLVNLLQVVKRTNTPLKSSTFFLCLRTSLMIWSVHCWKQNFSVIFFFHLLLRAMVPRRVPRAISPWATLRRAYRLSINIISTDSGNYCAEWTTIM